MVWVTINTRPTNKNLQNSKIVYSIFFKFLLENFILEAKICKHFNLFFFILNSKINAKYSKYFIENLQLIFFFLICLNLLKLNNFS